mmetsp:Transcript_64358/g.178876  ORF Transcript_64358/g.178876 Transcript_64358/m.178876 type:complete len:340 (-) Transcript_64358:113-1132(-)|eukprot:CAMPEP_0117474214 /NCGR_PEP_ID=MMETSP0784-20121206/9170_1 /TAXON_ID=39447 /ORGANISM="" /LENGTH=339 /DNA_ID=CAMNT_0005268435 /DNA_START=20 /DNA_END=1039 /DNA_ORIENTATION=-
MHRQRRVYGWAHAAVLAAFGVAIASAQKAPALADGKGAAGGWEKKTKEDGRVVQELKIEAPAFTEEDQYGYIMPERYRCDSCKAIMFHLDQDIRKKHPKSRRMKNWEYTDVFDTTCREAFQGYGVKLIDGENTLSGPGLLHNEEKMAPGSGAIQMGGESWTKRLGELCREIVYEKVGEEEIYEKLYAKRRTELDSAVMETADGLSEALCTKELRYCSVGPKPPRAKKAESASEKPEKSKEAKAKPKAPKAPKKIQTPATPAKSGSGTSSSSVSSSLSDSPAGDHMDVQSFLRRLATKHGLTSDEYLTAKTEREWEKLTLAMAGRIFGQAAEDNGKCRAA